jgi:hypothetical protein
MRIIGMKFNGLSAQLTVGPDALELRRLRGSFASGVLPADRNSLFIELAAPNKFNGHLQVDGADLKQLHAERTGVVRDLAGKVSATVAYSGEGKILNRLSAIGSISLTDGRLWELPFFSTLSRFGVLRALGVEETPVFNKGKVDFRIAEGRVYLDDVLLDSAALSLSGSGKLGRSGMVIDIVPSVGPNIPIIGTLFSPVIDLIKQGTLAFQVFGTYHNPRFRYRPLQMITWGENMPVDEPVSPERRERKLRERF